MSDTYKARCECYNCKTRFFARSAEEAFIHFGDSVELAIEIPKGTKIADIKCPKCGCQTLGGESILED